MNNNCNYYNLINYSYNIFLWGKAQCQEVSGFTRFSTLSPWLQGKRLEQSVSASHTLITVSTLTKRPRGRDQVFPGGRLTLFPFPPVIFVLTPVQEWLAGCLNPSEIWPHYLSVKSKQWGLLQWWTGECEAYC